MHGRSMGLVRTGALALLVSALLLAVAGMVSSTRARAQAGFDADVTLETTAIDPRTGVVTISGQVTCSQPADVFIGIELEQVTGKSSRYGGNSTWISCSDAAPFSLTVHSWGERFKPGPAVVHLFLSGCIGSSPYPAPGECDIDSRDITTRLRPAR